MGRGVMLRGPFALWYDVSMRTKKPREKRSKIRVVEGQRVVVARDIHRATESSRALGHQELYASQGERGVVKKFLPLERDHPQNIQVVMDLGGIKTFRITSVTPESEYDKAE